MPPRPVTVLAVKIASSAASSVASTAAAKRLLIHDPGMGRGADPLLTCLVCKRENCDWEFTFPQLVLGARVTTALHDECATALAGKP